MIMICNNKNNMTLSWFLNNAIIVLFVCLSISLLVIFKTCIKTRKLRFSDVFYLGHVFILTMLLFTAYSIIYYKILFHQRRSTFSQLLWNAEPERRVELVDDLIAVDRLCGRAKRVCREHRECEQDRTPD